MLQVAFLPSGLPGFSGEPGYPGNDCHTPYPGPCGDIGYEGPSGRPGVCLTIHLFVYVYLCL